MREQRRGDQVLRVARGSATVRSHSAWASLTALCLMLAGCGANLNAGGHETGSIARRAPVAQAGGEATDPLSCRRITGRMQVRILQVRDRLETGRPSFGAALGQMLNSGFLRTQGSSDAIVQRTADDVAALKAYNRELAKKKCPTFDLAAELKPQPLSHTPRPIIPPKP